MSKATADSSPRMGSPLVIGVLTIVSALLAVAINRSGGEWPVGLGGWGAAAFLVAGAVLVGYHFLSSETGQSN